MASSTIDREPQVLPMASAMFFGATVFATTALTAKALSVGNLRTLRASIHSRASGLDIRSLASVYALLYHMSLLGLILLYAYICEHHPPFPHAPKTYDRDEFFFLVALLFVVSVFTLKKHTTTDDKREMMTTAASNNDASRSPPRFNASSSVNDGTDILNRPQTEEWKGWMQFLFLLYHYHHATEVYNVIRVLITCYLWMTGFGNLRFFYTTGDYSLVRVLQMLWRLNFLALWLCVTQGTTYILYYICFLHTYYFGMVYATMCIRKDLNYTRMGLRYKLTILAVLIYLVWDVDSGAFRLLNWPVMDDRILLGAKFGMGWEVYFRTSLDHWSTFLGMLFACNFSVVSVFFRKLEAETWSKHVQAKGIMAICLLVAMFAWITGPLLLPKLVYNQTNAFFAPVVPLLAYVFFRNLTPWLRNHTLELLHQLGKTTLETYLMQHHIWMTSNSKTLLVLVPGWPKMNFLVVSIIYMGMSRQLYELTLYLRGMILPNNHQACLRNLAGLFGGLGCFYLVAYALYAVEALNLVSVAVVALLSGLALFTIVNMTALESYHESSTDNVLNSATKKPPSSAFRNPLLAPTSGALATLIIGGIWQQMRINGASKLSPLSDSCGDAVQTGQWIPMNVCGEDLRGKAYRDHGLSALGTCYPQSEAYTWGWKATPSSSHCQFAQRSEDALLTRLSNRTVTFVGDSIIRHLYHAMCRQVRDTSAGAYNTSMGKWQDFSRRYGTTDLEFRWAPFNDLLIDAISNIKTHNASTDLVVIGGGPWDRLHRYGNESERTALADGVQVLVRKLAALRSGGISVIWVTPTTINSWALTSDEKRNAIREDQMQDLRKVYKDAGIHAAVSWVLVGASFTVDRVAESYDGVHYPLSVYDGGAQIIANAIDWLLPEAVVPGTAGDGHNIGTMAQPILGLCMLACVMIGIYMMDSFFGMSYLASLIVPTVRPSTVFNESCRLHQIPVVERPLRSNSYNSQDWDKSSSSDEDEMESLVG